MIHLEIIRIHYFISLVEIPGSGTANKFCYTLSDDEKHMTTSYNRKIASKQ